MKKLEHFFAILEGTAIGLFLGKLLYLLWHTRAYPEFYAMQSAPWYLSILLNGLFTAVILLVLLVLRRLVKRKLT